VLAGDVMFEFVFRGCFPGVSWSQTIFFFHWN